MSHLVSVFSRKNVILSENEDCHGAAQEVRKCGKVTKKCVIMKIFLYLCAI